MLSTLGIWAEATGEDPATYESGSPASTYPECDEDGPWVQSQAGPDHPRKNGNPFTEQQVRKQCEELQESDGRVPYHMGPGVETPYSGMQFDLGNTHSSDPTRASATVNAGSIFSGLFGD